ALRPRVDPVPERQGHLAVGLSGEVDGPAPDQGLTAVPGEDETPPALLGQIIDDGHADAAARAGDQLLVSDPGLAAGILQRQRPRRRDASVDEIHVDAGGARRHAALLGQPSDRGWPGVAEAVAVGELGIVARPAPVARADRRGALARTAPQ